MTTETTPALLRWVALLVSSATGLSAASLPNETIHADGKTWTLGREDFRRIQAGAEGPGARLSL